MKRLISLLVLLACIGSASAYQTIWNGTLFHSSFVQTTNHGNNVSNCIGEFYLKVNHSDPVAYLNLGPTIGTGTCYTYDFGGYFDCDNYLLIQANTLPDGGYNAWKYGGIPHKWGLQAPIYNGSEAGQDFGAFAALFTPTVTLNTANFAYIIATNKQYFCVPNDGDPRFDNFHPPIELVMYDFNATTNQIEKSYFKSGDSYIVNRTFKQPATFGDPNTYVQNVMISQNSDTSTTTTTTLPGPPCSHDTDCGSFQFCKTGYTPAGYCVNQGASYDLDPNFVCHRNHECSGRVCDVSDQNNLTGDFPAYNISIPYPYSYNGNCQRASTLKVSVSPSPAILTLGGSFELFGKVTRQDGTNINSATCLIYCTSITPLSSTAWCYNQETNKINTEHLTDYYAGQPLPYVSMYSLNINSSLTNGVYSVIMQCIDLNGNYGADQYDFNYVGNLTNGTIQNGNQTKIVFSSGFPQTVATNTNVLVSFKYENQTGNTNIPGASCELEHNGVNTSAAYLSAGGYSISELFNVKGSNPVKVICTKTNYQKAVYSSAVIVQSTHCTNGIHDFDEDIGQIDCGGQDCSPCPTNPTCKYDGLSCFLNSDCCNHQCLNWLCQSATCTDGIQNQGEAGIDCGGPCSKQCSGCVNNNDCTIDGRSYCDQASGLCKEYNCTSDSDCRPLSMYQASTQTYMSQTEYCDLTDHLCKFRNENTSTDPIINPISGLTSNSSGTMLYLGNCEDGSNGLIITTIAKTRISYSFAYDPLSPNLGVYAYNIRFGDQGYSSDHKALIPELCGPNTNGLGGFPGTSERLYARINILACSEDGRCSNGKLIDFLNFKHNLKDALGITWITNNTATLDKLYQFQATNRSIRVFVRDDVSGQLVNLSSVYGPSWIFNQTSIGTQKTWIPTFYYYVNTTEGESISGRYGSPIWMPIYFDDKTQWFKLGFDFHAWMIYLIIAIVLMGLVYFNYRARRIKEAA